jgi:toxin ParE1/3/4
MTSRTRRIFLTPEARDDIKHILAYTDREWGRAQVSVYRDRLWEGFEFLLDNPFAGTRRDDILPGYRIWRIEKHFAIYKVEETRIAVIRVLHVHRDAGGEF